MEWTGVIIHTKDEALELVSNMLYGMGVQGIEFLDYVLDEEDKRSLFIDYIDEKLQENRDDVRIKCYFDEHKNINKVLEELQNNLDSLKQYVDVGSAKIEIEKTKEEDWANNWKVHYKPFKIGEHIWIKPTWETLEYTNENDWVIEIDPGMAFGSGTHETTSMCVQMIQRYMKKNDHVLDVGCGSGILGIAAAKLGAKSVECIDLDEKAVQVAKSNVQLNRLTSVTVKHGDLIEQAESKADVIVANILADVILFLTEEVKAVMQPDGYYISSGIIRSRSEEVENKLKKCGFTIVEKMTQGEWVAITAQMKE